MSAWWLIALSVSAGVMGQIAIKLGVGENGFATTGEGGLFALTLQIATTPLILGGLLLYGVGAVSWISVLGRMNLSHAYPFLALNFVLIAILSRFLLNEPIPTIRWVGMLVICAGIVLVSLGGSAQ